MEGGVKEERSIAEMRGGEQAEIEEKTTSDPIGRMRVWSMEGKEERKRCVKIGRERKTDVIGERKWSDGEGREGHLSGFEKKAVQERGEVNGGM
ncbi:hypothetical protein EYF80_023586 [Liparis tanakae]|uniref:Uncharacterized protein n=1 Tax=Liparis tanakae TaxID=230148 RepID=A0A4Z2HJW7_9TELE|nr:hypothetical protein EYF80_023586 [Liparis tanakae]